jgi:multiple antibiotic resistance protein
LPEIQETNAVADLTAYLKIFVAVYVLVNPLEGIPVFLARTQKLKPADRQMVAYVAALGVTVILLVSLFIGRGLLALLGISNGAFATSGGIIIFLVALKMVAGDVNEPQETDGDAEQSVRRFALVPLATPLLAGPGAISSVILYASKGSSGHGSTWLDDVVLSCIILVVGLATWAALRAAETLRRVLGETGIEVSTRISGILVAAIAVQLIQEGLVELFPTISR